MSHSITSDNRINRKLREGAIKAENEFSLATAIHFGMSEELVSKLTESQGDAALSKFMSLLGTLSGPNDTPMEPPSRGDILKRIERRIGASPDNNGTEWVSTPHQLIERASINFLRSLVLEAVKRDSPNQTEYSIDSTIESIRSEIPNFPRDILREFEVEVPKGVLSKAETLKDLVDLMIGVTIADSQLTTL